MHPFRIMCNHLQIGACRLVGLRPALLPIPQCAEWDLIACGEFFLRESQCAAQLFSLAAPAAPCAAPPPSSDGRRGRRPLLLRLPPDSSGAWIGSTRTHCGQNTQLCNQRGHFALDALFDLAGLFGQVNLHRDIRDIPQ